MSWLDRLATKAAEDNFTPATVAIGKSGRFPWTKDVTGLESNVVMSPIGWVMRNFTEAEPVVERRTSGTWDIVEDHELTTLLDQPNPFYGGSTLWKASIVSWFLDGNAYWQLVRNAFGELLGMWYLPHFAVTPVGSQDGMTFIEYYEYRTGFPGGPLRISPRNIVHLRLGLDPNNPRLGLSTIKPLLQEVFTDEEAATFAASILSNMGVPGGVIAPRDKAALPNSGDVKEMKEYMRSAFSGKRRGEWLVLGTPTEIQQFGFDPNNLMLGNLRDIAEERVCAALGVPAAVVGFGSGLQQTKVGATMKELRKEAWDSCITPTQNEMAKQLTRQLLPEFVSQTRRFRVRFDRSMFAASQEEESEKAARIGTLVEKGVLRVDRAQSMLRLEVDETQKVYLRPSGVTAIGEDGQPVAPAAPPAPDGAGAEGGGTEEGQDDDQELLAAIAARAGVSRNGNSRNSESEG